MARIDPVLYPEASPAVKDAYDAQVKQNGPISNMKKTLLRSLPAYQALMQWYPLREAAEKFLSPREIVIFCHAISTQNECLICSTYFRRDFFALGISPETAEFSAQEKLLESFGRAIAKDANKISEDFFVQLQKNYTAEQLVLLSAFGALMFATNLINNILQVDLDESLTDYLKVKK